MKQVRCAFISHFYIDVPDNAHADMIEDAIEREINQIESNNEEHFCIDEYDWEVRD